MALIQRRDLFTPQQPEVYSDFQSNLEQHPVKQDILRHTNENAVKRSVRNLLLTNRGERFFDNDLGSDIRTLLFEPFTPATEQALQTLISTTIKNYEPRARLIEVKTSADPDQHRMYVTIIFGLINSQEPITLQLTLDRIR